MKQSLGLFVRLWAIVRVCQGLELGWFASMHNWPFVASLGYTLTEPPEKMIWFCTGTIINGFHILSTQGCVEKTIYKVHKVKYVATLIRVWVGSGYALEQQLPTGPSEAQYMAVSQIFVPTPEDTRRTLGFDNNQFQAKDYTYYYLDFSILRLAKELNFNRFVQPARFDVRTFRDARQQYVPWKRRLDDETDYIPDCYMAGWGFNDNGDAESKSTRLLYTRLKFTPRMKCDLAYCTNCSVCSNSTEHLPNLYWCFSSYLWSDTCPGDQGAPLFCPWFGYKTHIGRKVGAILGIHSAKPGTCNQATLPSKFSAIWFAYNFIERILDQGRFPPPPLDIGDPDWAY
uniref:Kallikrein-1 n=1 Tax=Lygus hesperus TaxID=30085 RepID=A0A0A9Z3Z0_LYGHE